LAIASKTETESKVKKLTKLESQIESNLSKFQRDINFFQGNDNCPTCRQAIALGFKEEELHSLSLKVGECTHGLSKLEEKLLEEQAKLKNINLLTPKFGQIVYTKQETLFEKWWKVFIPK
jgi:inorganic triphosphatase YgiF